MFEHIEIYRSIAVEALQSAQRAFSTHSQPRPDGQAGSVIKIDPARMSFKQSMIAIAFAWMYLESLLFIRGSPQLGRAAYLSLRPEYEERLARIAIVNKELLERCAAFRAARNDLLHEKDSSDLRVAQKEAEKALTLIRDVSIALKYPWPEA